jgi:hypothetical protein
MTGLVMAGLVPAMTMEGAFVNPNKPRAFSGKVESGFPSESATKAKMLERFLVPVSVKPL